MKINLNDKVRVRLTDRGRAIHRENHDALFCRVHVAYAPPKEDADGWSTWQLWELMNEFGKHCYNGCRVPFETEIEHIGSAA